MQIAQRDRIMTIHPYNRINFVDDPTVFDTEVWRRPNHIYDDDDLDRANKQLSSMFNLYNGYMMISLNSRDEILESEFVKM